MTAQDRPLTQPPTQLHNLAQALIVFGLAVACLAGFASLPIMPMVGVWYQSTPVTGALFAGAALCAGGLALAAFSTPQAAKLALWHPLVAIPVLISLWSWAAPAYTGAAIQSFFGAPQIGLGGAWFLSLAVMTGGARYIFNAPSAPRHKLVSALAVIALVSALAIITSDLWAPGGWRPFFFSDYLAFHALYIWVIAAFWLPHAKWSAWIGLILCGVIIFSTGNRTAYGALIFAVASLFAIQYLQSRFSASTLRRLSTWGIGLMALLTPVGIYFLHRVGLPDSVPHDIIYTFKSRSLLLETVIFGIINNPAMVLTGIGWGNFSELVFSQIPIDQTAIWAPAAARAGDDYLWEALWQLHFHTHNELAEHLASGGIPSLALWLGYLVLVPLLAAQEKRATAVAFTVGYVLLSAMWFQMPGGLALMAIAVAGLGSKPCVPPAAEPSPSRRPWSAAFAAAAFLTLAASSATTFKNGYTAAQNVERNFAPNSTFVQPFCGGDAPAVGAGLTEFSELMKSFATSNIDRLRAGKDVEAWRFKRLDDYLCRADELMAQGGPLSVGVRALTLRSDFAFPPKPLKQKDFEARLYSGWDKNVNWVLTRAPSRTDLALPYLSWLLGKGAEAQALQLSEHMLKANPADPVGLWFSGVVLLNDISTKSEGIQRLKQALHNNIEKIMPVEPDLKAQLENL